MRDDHHVDRVAVDPGGREIGVILADRALALLVHAKPKPGIDGDQLGAGIHDHRRIGVVDLVLGQEVGFERGVDIGLGRIRDIGVGQRIGVGAVGDDRDLEGADLVAVPARRLLAGGRRGRARRRSIGASGSSAVAAAPKRVPRRVSAVMVFPPSIRAFGLHDRASRLAARSAPERFHAGTTGVSCCGGADARMLCAPVNTIMTGSIPISPLVPHTRNRHNSSRGPRRFENSMHCERLRIARIRQAICSSTPRCPRTTARSRARAPAISRVPATG